MRKTTGIDSVTKEDLLAVLSARGIIGDETELFGAIEEMKRKELLAMHDISIWQGKDGRWRTYIRDKTTGKRKMIAKSTRKGIEDVLCDYYRDMVNDPSVEDVFADWIEKKTRRKEIAESSRIKYEDDFTRFFAAHGLADRRIKSVTAGDLTAFIESVITDGITAKSFAGMKILLRGIFGYAREQGLTDLSMAVFFEDLRLSKNTFKTRTVDPDWEVMHEDEIPALKEYLLKKGDIWSLGVLLQLQTGMRRGELSALKWGDWDGEVLKVRRTEAKRRVNGKQEFYVTDMPKTDAGMRSIILTASAVDTLRRIRAFSPGKPEEEDWIFRGRSGQRILGNSFNKHLTEALNDLGMRHRSSHKLRKTYGTELKEGGADDTVVQRQLGHKDITTTLKYYVYGNKSRERQRRQVEDAITF